MNEQAKNIALAQEIAANGNFEVIRITHLATLAAHCNSEEMQDFCDSMAYAMPEELTVHRLPYMQEFYQRMAQLIAETGMMDSDDYRQISDMILETGACGFLLEAARPEDDTWDCCQTRYFYAESYAEALREAMDWAAKPDMGS